MQKPVTMVVFKPVRTAVVAVAAMDVGGSGASMLRQPVQVGTDSNQPGQPEAGRQKH